MAQGGGLVKGSALSPGVKPLPKPTMIDWLVGRGPDDLSSRYSSNLHETPKWRIVVDESWPGGYAGGVGDRDYYEAVIRRLKRDPELRACVSVAHDLAGFDGVREVIGAAGIPTYELSR